MGEFFRKARDFVMAKPRIQLIVEGLNAFARKMNIYREVRSRGFTQALRSCARLVLERADHYIPIDRNPYRPADKEHMRDTATVEKHGAAPMVSFTAGYTAPYAVYVHENLNMKHGADFNRANIAKIAAGRERERRPQETAKWLEIAIDELRARRRLEAQIEVIMGDPSEDGLIGFEARLR